MKREETALLVLGAGGLAAVAAIVFGARQAAPSPAFLKGYSICAANSGYANPVPTLCGANSLPVYAPYFGQGAQVYAELAGGGTWIPRKPAYPPAYPPILEMPGGAWRGGPVVGREPAGLLG